MISKFVSWFLHERVIGKARAIGILIGVLAAIFAMMTKAHAFLMMDIIEFGHPLDIELVEPELRMFEWEKQHDSDKSENKESSSKEKETVLTDSDMGNS